jgi:hypothetical protein
MIEGSLPAFFGAAALVSLSFFSFVAGVVFRKWPDKVQEYSENFDGSVYFLPPELQRALVKTSGTALVLISFLALLATSLII